MHENSHVPYGYTNKTYMDISVYVTYKQNISASDGQLIKQILRNIKSKYSLRIAEKLNSFNHLTYKDLSVWNNSTLLFLKLTRTWKLKLETKYINTDFYEKTYSSPLDLERFFGLSSN